MQAAFLAHVINQGAFKSSVTCQGQNFASVTTEALLNSVLIQHVSQLYSNQSILMRIFVWKANMSGPEHRSTAPQKMSVQIL